MDGKPAVELPSVTVVRQVILVKFNFIVVLHYLLTWFVHNFAGIQHNTRFALKNFGNAKSSFLDCTKTGLTWLFH